MTTITKKAARKEVVALVDDNITAITEAFNHRPNSFDGKTPVVTVSSGYTSSAFNLNTPDNDAQFLVTVWAVRVDDTKSIEREAAAEDDIDDFSDSFVSEIETWDNGEFSRESIPDYGVLDGVQYRTETHFVAVNLER